MDLKWGKRQPEPGQGSQPAKGGPEVLESLILQLRSMARERTKVLLAAFAVAVLCGFRTQGVAQSGAVAVGDGLETLSANGSNGRPDVLAVARRLRTALEVGDRNAVERILISVGRLRADPVVGAAASLVFVDVLSTLSIRRAPVLPSAGLKDGESHSDGVWRVLGESLARHPYDSLLAHRFVQLAIAGGDRLPRAVQVDALARLLSSERVTGNAWLLSARWHRLSQRFDSATVALEYARSLRADSGLVALEAAHLAIAVGDTATGVSEFWRGLSARTVEGKHAYLLVLKWLLGPEMSTDLENVSDSLLETWVRKFWRERDALSLRAPDGALAEYLRRYNVALSRFRVVDPGRRAQFKRVELGFEGLSDRCAGTGTPLYELLAKAQPFHPQDVRSREPILDHRGIIYLRHGDPLGVASSADESQNLSASSTFRAEWLLDPSARLAAQIALSMQSNESWLYWIDGEWRMLHFRGSRAMGMYAPTTLSSVLPGGFEAWNARARLMPQYGDVAIRLLTRSEISGPSELECSVKQSSRAASLLAVQTDSDSPPIVRPWGAVFQAFTVGSGRSNDGRLVMTFALPTRALTFDSLGVGKVASVEFEVRAFDRVSGSAVMVDTLRRFLLPSRPRDGDYIQGLIVLPVSDGDWAVGLRAKQADDSSGGYFSQRHLIVPRGDQPALSDLLLGGPRGVGPLATPGEPIRLHSLATWRVGERVDFYLEAYGLRAGHPYDLRLQIAPLQRERSEPITVSESGIAGVEVTRVWRSVSLLVPRNGRYELTVEIRQDGTSLRTSRAIVVTP